MQIAEGAILVNIFSQTEANAVQLDVDLCCQLSTNWRIKTR